MIYIIIHHEYVSSDTTRVMLSRQGAIAAASTETVINKKKCTFFVTQDIKKRIDVARAYITPLCTICAYSTRERARERSRTVSVRCVHKMCDAAKETARAEKIFKKKKKNHNYDSRHTCAVAYTTLCRVLFVVCAMHNSCGAAAD